MATWQADFHVFVPGALPADYRERLALLLPPGKSWHEGLEMSSWRGSHAGIGPRSRPITATAIVVA